MTNLEIARVFNEEYGLKEEVLHSLINEEVVSMGYLIYAEDHEPLTEEQQKVMDEYGCKGIIELYVEINLDDLIE